MRKVEVEYDQQQAKLIIQEGKFDEAATRAALAKGGYGMADRLR